MEGFWRKPRADMENVRFSTSNSKYPDEGSSNGYSSNYMESLVLSRFMAYTDFFFLLLAPFLERLNLCSKCYEDEYVTPCFTDTILCP